MAAAQKRDWEGTSRRRVPRFELQAPVDVTVMRSGMPNTVPGRSTNLGERGVAAVIAGELVSGETVEIELKLSPTAEPLCMHAIVRYQDEQRCGLEFVAMTPEQRAVIREWARDPKAEGPPTMTGIPIVRAESDARAVSSSRTHRKPGLVGGVIFFLLVGAALLFGWKWNQSWRQLEAGSRSSTVSVTEKPSLKVSAEEMQKLLIHRVEPAYPAEARAQNLQGIIALDIVVGRDGSVRSVRALNGPDVLAKAATDALRWWKFQPYRVNGEPVSVESTLAVEFKR